ncbi:bifunctional oligoribonuclease/PAP phosphatase NrnA [Lachnospiraceae bacterium NSJ-29]|uniref:Bifunctional oligoribonuclease/PAP phosphatase NrnA n=2 Tax=Wansuia hejianensis TaxID=2763667 RepID=A0A926F1Y2_9FIRM|nr:bifunctional oligoribonuclease/PAP phosphatase NrnA [Wansuia hejianensis]
MNKSTNHQMDEAIKLILQYNNIFIASHINPDGDNIGSMLAISLALRKINKNVSVLKSDVLPEDFMFLPGSHDIQEYKEELGPIDIFIVVDCSDEDRLGNNKALLSNAKKVINIDHHISNTMFGDLNIVDPKSAATGELIYKLIKKMGISLDIDIGSNLYTAISTDTGKFSYESVTSRTHRIIAELIDIGVDFNTINLNLYENMSIEKTKLFIQSLSTLKFYEGNSIVTLKITKEMLKHAGAKMEDAEGIISFIRKIESVEVACVLKEIEMNNIKISLRSKRDVDVALIAQSFDGGGHIRAAGCSINSNIEEAEKEIVGKIREVVR